MELILEELTHEIVPGVLEKDWSEIEKKLTAAKGFARSAHIDLLDGKFAQNTTFLDPKPFEPFSKDLFLELHMMVENPIVYLEPFAKAGFRRFIGHIEKMPNVNEFIALAQTYGEVGLAIDGPTDIEVLDKVNLEDLDCILVYTCEKVGFAGPPFDPSKLEKVRALRGRTQIPIETDGGMKDTTVLFARNAGANRFVATSFIWGADNPKEAYEKLVREVTS